MQVGADGMQSKELEIAVAARVSRAVMVAPVVNVLTRNKLSTQKRLKYDLRRFFITNNSKISTRKLFDTGLSQC